MLSIIVCSISPKNLQELSVNIQDTIRVPYEIIGVDNRELNWPISRVYNYAAAKARFKFLLFVHEDVRFLSSDWDKIIIEKLSEPQCGVIGFAGSKVMRRVYSGWFQSTKWECVKLYQGLPNGTTELHAKGVTQQKAFEEVVTLDGLAMFMRKDVWDIYPFDENNLTGFHCYDIDLSLSVAYDGRYRNYVCISPDVLVEHRSGGNLNSSWFDETIKMYHKKWKYKLPIHVEGESCENLRMVRKDELKAMRLFVKNAFRCNYAHRWKLLAKYLFLQTE